MATDLVYIYPGYGLASLNLGASLHEIVSLIHNDTDTYPQIDIHYDKTNPLTTPIIISLPQNGFRLRFDGPDQRLRLIEILDFRKTRLAYKGSELVKSPEEDFGPGFRRVYHLFGASYPGEYHAPKYGDLFGNYVLSWAGVAFTFPLQDSAWSPEKDHVSLLSSSAAKPAITMSIFEGSSWPEARDDLFIRAPSGPRLSAVANRPKDNLPIEIEEANIQSTVGQVELIRRSPALPFTIVLNQTTPQDLITELGPPDATHKRETDQISIPDQPRHARAGSISNGPLQPEGRGSRPSSYSSTGTDTFDADFDSGDADEDPKDRPTREVFWSFFSHGMDILIGPPNEPPSNNTDVSSTPLTTATHLVVTKVILHGNVPGSYSFNRHRRLRWSLHLPDTNDAFTSETKFSDLQPELLRTFHGVWPDNQMGRGKVVNRTWGGGGDGSGIGESGFFLPDAETDLVEGGGGEAWLGNTRVFAFPRLGVEVLENGCLGGVTVY